jgi:hypothetical protein
MTKYLVSFLMVIISCHCLAQDEEEGKAPAPVSRVYHQYREYTTTPPYGIEKVRQLIKAKTARREEDNDTGMDSLPPKLYRALSLREKFTYNMIFGESFYQNCDIDEPVPDEEKKIFGELPRLFSEEGWSNRQLDFFKENKDSVMALMIESIGRAKRVGLNYKHAIVEINAMSMIPLLIDMYNLQKKDHDILTVLMLLMRDNKYPPFMASASYTKLYAGKDSYYSSSLVFNPANEALIIQRAMDFYHGVSK